MKDKELVEITDIAKRYYKYFFVIDSILNGLLNDKKEDIDSSELNYEEFKEEIINSKNIYIYKKDIKDITRYINNQFDVLEFNYGSPYQNGGFVDVSYIIYDNVELLNDIPIFCTNERLDKLELLELDAMELVNKQVEISKTDDVIYTSKYQINKIMKDILYIKERIENKLT